MKEIYRCYAYGQGEHLPPDMKIMDVGSAEEAKKICDRLNASLHGSGFEYTSWDNPRFCFR